MSTFQKIALAIIAVGAITTLVMPTHQSANVINAIGGAFSKALGTAVNG